ncbi:MAG: hypothetical protein C0623_01385 [Desulfuromonas sp.]|nr:MAG: hypothetical protein C0623_01385 [Desulfuromonas sp.]
MKKIALFLIVILIPATVLAGEGMISVQSTHDVTATADRLETILKDKGMTVFNRINHSAGAAKVGVELRPTELIIFGNPKVGSRLMKCAQGTAIDLPQKALIREDADGNTFISYNNPAYIRKRHSISGCDEVLQKITNALANFSKAAAGE